MLLVAFWTVYVVRCIMNTVCSLLGCVLCVVCCVVRCALRLVSAENVVVLCFVCPMFFVLQYVIRVLFVALLIQCYMLWLCCIRCILLDAFCVVFSMSCSTSWFAALCACGLGCIRVCARMLCCVFECQAGDAQFVKKQVNASTAWSMGTPAGYMIVPLWKHQFPGKVSSVGSLDAPYKRSVRKSFIWQAALRLAGASFTRN